MARVVEDVRNRLTAALERGELTPATIARLLATVHAHAQLAGVNTDAPVVADPAAPPEPGPEWTPTSMLDAVGARDLAWAERRRIPGLDD